jgi:hypothetical protein
MGSVSGFPEKNKTSVLFARELRGGEIWYEVGSWRACPNSPKFLRIVAGSRATRDSEVIGGRAPGLNGDIEELGFIPPVTKGSFQPLYLLSATIAAREDSGGYR